MGSLTDHILMFSMLVFATNGDHIIDILDIHQRNNIFGTSSTHLMPDFRHISVEELNIESMSDVKQFRKRPPRRLYQMTIDNETFLLNLRPNTDMFTDECIIREIDENGTTTVRPCSDYDIDCFYTGSTNVHNDSWVAANVCGGLRGLISYGNTSLVIHPFVNKRNSSDVANHIVYRYQSEKQVCKTNGSPVWTHVVLPPRKRDVPIRFIETGVIVDPAMYQYHREKIMNYVFTGFNIASKLYADPSIGTDIELLLKELVIFKSNNGFDVDNSPNADKTLSSMCQFQSQHLTLQTTDVTMMLTRLDIEHEEERETTGLANVGGACEKTRKCGIVEDTGPVFGITFAHEIGHLLGMSHDGSGNNNCTPHIMSPGGHSGIEGFTWSDCSASQLHESLQSLSCLTNNPGRHSGTFSRDHKLPGMIYTANDQCQLLYDKSAKSLISTWGHPCKNLCCYFNGAGSCLSQPVMDGTDCNNTRSWCFRGSCVHMNETFNTAPVHGGWSKWDETFTSCTATCGGGVKFKYRYCNNPVPQYGGRECSGPKFIAKICNVVPCSYAPALQNLCQKLNKSPSFSAKGQWHMDQNDVQLIGDEGCKYVCKTNNSDKSKNVVKQPYPDGWTCTHIDLNPLNRCIASVCRSFGCDGFLGSNYSYDSCGVCNGNGKTCRRETFTVANNLTSYMNGFQSVTIVPQGSTDVVIEQNNTDVYLGIKVNNITLFDAGNVQNETLIDTHGVRLIYMSHPESIRINGPLFDHFLIVAQSRSSANHSRGFSVSVNYHVKDYDVSSRYVWGERKSTCSRSCGGGLRPHNIACMDGFMFYNKAEDYLCDIRTKPNEEPTPCNEHPCPYIWSAGKWSDCSVTCGHGQKRRNNSCLQFTDGEDQVVPDDLCASEKKLDYQMSCDLGKCWKWHIKHESSCSKTCSEGFKNRTIICIEADTFLELPIDTCDAEKKPSDMVNCNHGPCMKSSNCTDDTDHCKYTYGDDICHGEYSSWAERNCSKSCGVCVKEDNVLCLQYVDSLKWDDLCKGNSSNWAASHCRLTCSSCTFEPDRTNCTIYYPDSCTDSRYQSWMSKNCGRYCCSNLVY